MRTRFYSVRMLQGHHEAKGQEEWLKCKIFKNQHQQPLVCSAKSHTRIQGGGGGEGLPRSGYSEVWGQIIWAQVLLFLLSVWL